MSIWYWYSSETDSAESTYSSSEEKFDNGTFYFGRYLKKKKNDSKVDSFKDPVEIIEGDISKHWKSTSS